MRHEEDRGVADGCRTTDISRRDHCINIFADAVEFDNVSVEN